MQSKWKKIKTHSYVKICLENKENIAIQWFGLFNYRFCALMIVIIAFVKSLIIITWREDCSILIEHHSIYALEIEMLFWHASLSHSVLLCDYPGNYDDDLKYKTPK